MRITNFRCGCKLILDSKNSTFSTECESFNGDHKGVCDCRLTVDLGVEDIDEELCRKTKSLLTYFSRGDELGFSVLINAALVGTTIYES